jgi:TolA-binding protein
MSQLEATARAIQSQLQLSNTLSLGAMSYATTGGVIEDGALDTAMISQAMMNDYNAAIDAVINSTYATAQTVFMDAHNNAIDRKSTRLNSSH